MARDTVADVERMLRRAPDAKTFVFGRVWTHCVMDDAQDVVRDDTGGELRLAETSVLIANGSVTGLSRGAAVTIAGTAYTVRELLKAENGDLLRVVVVPA